MAKPLDLKDAYTPDRAWDTARILPDGFLPMLASPAIAPLDRPEYGYEVKWEGLRVLAGLEGNNLMLRTSAGQDPKHWFPELAGLRGAAEPEWVLLDGELIVQEMGLPSLSRLQQRVHAADHAAVAQAARSAPAVFMVYDVLRIGDSWLLDVAWEERRDILERAVAPGPLVQLSDVAGEGNCVLTHARRLGLSSVVAKRLRGKYAPGERTREWVNIKPAETVDAVIGGWTVGRGAREDTIGTLFLGMYQGRDLVYIGHTGTGLTGELLRTLPDELRRRSQPECPFQQPPSGHEDALWVRPDLVCRVRHQGWAPSGKLRSATFMEMVEEGSANECRIPAAAAAG
jgi:bifunctional non-homologous end joining protein LigD